MTRPLAATVRGMIEYAVVNFPPRRIAGLASEVLVLGAMGEGGEVWLLSRIPRARLGRASADRADYPA